MTARAQLLEIFQNNRPRPPDELSHRGDGIFGIHRRGYYGWQSGTNYENAQLSTSRLEWALASHGPAEPFVPQPRTYLAIVENSLDVPVGVDDARQAGSFHVVRGLW